VTSPAEQSPNLRAAYSLQTPDDNRRLYAEWADNYDETFVAATGYVYHQQVAQIFSAAAAAVASPAGPVLDVGCGTGLVGVALAAQLKDGVTAVDGVDISPEMLEQAATTGVYRRLFEADLTVGIDIGDSTYAGLVSAGTFTHGHLSADPLSELIRVGRPGAVAVIGVNAAHWEDHGFADWFEDAAARSVVSEISIRKVPVYARSDPDDPDQNSNVVTFVIG